VNPGVNFVSAVWSIDNDAPPQDDYRGQPIVPKDQWDAGYASRAWGLAKHLMTTIGGRPKMPNPDLGFIPEAIRNTPGLGRIFPFDNYQGVREQRRDELEDKRISATARNMRGPETVKAMRRMEALETKGSPDGDKPHKRTTREDEEYSRLRDWYNEYYEGAPDFPGNIHILKAKAAGKNVDADAAVQTLEETAKAALSEGKKAAAELKE
jgi:hypothetical protein